MKKFLIDWLMGMEICLTWHVVIISLAYECLMVVMLILGFVLGFHCMNDWMWCDMEQHSITFI